MSKRIRSHRQVFFIWENMMVATPNAGPRLAAVTANGGIHVVSKESRGLESGTNP